MAYSILYFEGQQFIPRNSTGLKSPAVVGNQQLGAASHDETLLTYWRGTGVEHYTLTPERS